MDQSLIDQKLESLRRCLHRLETRCPADIEILLRDLDAQDVVALNLTRAVQLCVDLASHWLSSHQKQTAPRTMGQAFDRLAEAGMITPQVAKNMRKAVGFRNIVIHNYEDIDWNIVFSICQTRLDDFRQFAKVFADSE